MSDTNEHVLHVLGFFSKLENLASDEIETHLLVTPKLGSDILTDDRIKRLLRQGLEAPSPAVRLLVLKTCLKSFDAMEDKEDLFSNVVPRIGDVVGYVAAMASQVVCTFATAKRMADNESLFHQLLSKDSDSDSAMLRVFELAANLINGSDSDMAECAVVTSLVDKLIEVAKKGDDVLLSMALLELVGGTLSAGERGAKRALKMGFDFMCENSDLGSFLKSARIRASAGMLSGGGKYAVERSIEAGLLERTLSVIESPQESKREELSAYLKVVEGLAANGNAGQQEMLSKGIYAHLVAMHESSAEQSIRLQSYATLLSVLHNVDTLNSDFRKDFATILEGKGGHLVVQLLRYASAPLMEEEKKLVMQLLVLIAKLSPLFAIQSAPSLLNWTVQRSEDDTLLAAHARLSLANVLLSAPSGVLNNEQHEALSLYVRQGLYYSEATPSFQSSAQ